ncbi:hypothetical protein BT63DRAFT_444612 [Microthyrium microscopicum]|uniref:Uncharacterized protein n=1 Tax=Microthyrium microscopicum TaxID=703497 RepID=A0A6A6TX84_9PEZI|nr:hypothetical protein BT63DRAFT_444612 [Microthyrium microscopicum]
MPHILGIKSIRFPYFSRSKSTTEPPVPLPSYIDNDDLRWRQQFTRYLKSQNPDEIAARISEVFEVTMTPEEAWNVLSLLHQGVPDFNTVLPKQYRRRLRKSASEGSLASVQTRDKKGEDEDEDDDDGYMALSIMSHSSTSSFSSHNTSPTSAGEEDDQADFDILDGHDDGYDSVTGSEASSLYEFMTDKEENSAGNKVLADGSLSDVPATGEAGEEGAAKQ